jgi:hypothetical protein
MASTTEVQRADHKHLLCTENKPEGLLQSMETIKRGNDKIMVAYYALHNENTVLKTAIEDLTQQIMNQTVMPSPPSPTTDITTSSTMEEMTLQILDVQRDIQDMLDAVGNPTGKRKCAHSNTYTPDDEQLTSPTARRPTAQKQCDVSPVHSLMHSCHVTTAAQEVLDAFALSSSQNPPAKTLTDVTDPTRTITTEPDITIPEADTATPTSTPEWRIVMDKATRRRDKATAAGKN